MSLRLRNQKNPNLILNLTDEAWFGVLDLAEAYGWNPMGTIQPDYWANLDLDLHNYAPVGMSRFATPEAVRESRLVLLEDALNLADALEHAFLDYEPIRLPASYFYFETDDSYFRSRPAIGVITTLTDFSRCGSFWIERYQVNVPLPLNV